MLKQINEIKPNQNKIIESAKVFEKESGITIAIYVWIKTRNLLIKLAYYFALKCGKIAMIKE